MPCRRSSSARIGRTRTSARIAFYVQDRRRRRGAARGRCRPRSRALDPNLPVENPKTMAQQVRENVFLDRMISTLSAGFAVLATLLAAVGLYGVLAYTVSQRTREFGLRMALGADGASVRGMVLGQVARMTAMGGGRLAWWRRRPSASWRSRCSSSWRATTRWCWWPARCALVLVALAAGLVPALRAVAHRADGRAALGLAALRRARLRGGAGSCATIGNGAR